MYQGHFFPGVDARLPLNVNRKIEDAVGTGIDVVLQFWRLSKPGDPSPTGVHADQSAGNTAGVLYMSPEPDDPMDGTAFWRHKDRGTDHVPPAILQGSTSEQEEYYKQLNADTKDMSAWDMTALARSKFNRFITYPSHYFHSRYPIDPTNYGSTKDSARLTWVVFFNT